METITQEEVTKANKWILDNVEGSQAIRISQLERGMVVLFLRKVDYDPKRGTELTLDSTEVKSDVNMEQARIKDMDAMTDLELVDYWIESGCVSWPDPRMFRHINSRGLYGIIDRLDGRTHAQLKASARARMAARGKYIGDPEIEAVASLMDRIGTIQEQLCQIKPSEAGQIRDTAERLARLADQLLNYFEK